MEDFEIVVIGLGYVGLGLAIEFGKVRPTLGIDIYKKRISELQKGIDINGELTPNQIISPKFLKLDSNLNVCNKERRAFFITVPTPIDSFKKPDLSYLEAATLSIAKVLNKGDIVVYESTTYPTCTRDFCIPILENLSGLKCYSDFGVGYCPERVNPGQNSKPLNEIVRVVAATDHHTLTSIEAIYKSINQETHKVNSLEIAEMSKLAENCQRDLNISFVNELAYICDKLEISTQEVLKAASTKWNFHHYQPGLVGGHCISVDPYYLIHKAVSIGYFPKVIGAGREVNEAMPAFIASKCVKLMIGKNISLKGAKSLILGMTFKENCSDIRNSKVFELINELKEYGILVDSYDPYINNEENLPQLKDFDLIILTVPHQQFLELDFNKIREDAVLFDVKRVLEVEYADGSL